MAHAKQHNVRAPGLLLTLHASRWIDGCAQAPFCTPLLYTHGTGNAMLGQRLTHQSGIDCTMMDGGDVGPLGSAA